MIWSFDFYTFLEDFHSLGKCHFIVTYNSHVFSQKPRPLPVKVSSLQPSFPPFCVRCRVAAVTSGLFGKGKRLSNVINVYGKWRMAHLIQHLVSAFVFCPYGWFCVLIILYFLSI